MTEAIETWPSEGLEQVEKCPVCGSGARQLLHEGLTDCVFLVAPGNWTMWQCSTCHSAYLDPRPSEATVGLAYRQYYTHAEPQVPESRSVIQRSRAMLGNGYRNYSYGTRLTPSLALGRWTATLLKPLAGPLDIAYRYLPRPTPGSAGRLLDIGCGSGSFLDLAKEAGWRGFGAEPDPISRTKAQERGFEVRISAHAWRDESGSFDYVTLSHAIEHVHDPIELLSDCFALLRPGGGLFIDTPNIDAIGHRIYGRDWLHLDPPRHLILFNRASLADSVSKAGFEELRFHPRPDAFRNSAEASRRIAAGLDPFSGDASATLFRAPGWLTRIQAKFAGQHAEFLTMTATKPAK